MHEYADFFFRFLYLFGEVYDIMSLRFIPAILRERG